MLNVFSNTQGNALSGNADNFKTIRGIGPAIESRLHQAGILTYDQLASKTPEELAPLLTGLTGFSPQRISNQDWIGQAHTLTSEEYIQAAADESTSENRQHYATYTLELLLDEENSVRRTRIVFVQEQDEKVWAGWDTGRLVDFITSSAQFQVPLKAETPVAIGTPEKESQSGTPAFPEAPAQTGNARLQEMVVFTTEDECSQSSVPFGHAFQTVLTIDLADLEIEQSPPLTYRAIVYAHLMGGGSRFPTGESSGTIQPSESQVQITIHCKPLPKGLYRLESAFILTPPLEPVPPMDHRSHFEGNLLQIY